MTVSARFALSLALLAVLCLGCDGSRVGATVPVTGKVLADGQALTTGSVAFHPEDPAGLVPGGTIDAQGNYELFVEGKKGAPAGKYKVTVVSQPMVDSSKASEPPPPSPVNSMFNSASTTPLNIEVKEGAAPGAYDLKVNK